MTYNKTGNNRLIGEIHSLHCCGYGKSQRVDLYCIFLFYFIERKELHLYMP